MHKVVGAVTALVLFSGACSSPEMAPSHISRAESAPAPTFADKLAVEEPAASPEITPPEPTEATPTNKVVSARLSQAALGAILEDRKSVFKPLYFEPIETSFYLLPEGKTFECTVEKDALSFVLEGNDPMAAYNCMADKKIVASEAFVAKHINSSYDPDTTAKIFFAHELGHIVIEAEGKSATTTDKDLGEAEADCLAGQSFWRATKKEKQYLTTVFSDLVDASIDEIDSRELAFGEGLLGGACKY